MRRIGKRLGMAFLSAGWLAVATACFAEESADAVPIARAESSRTFGHVIGDIVEQRVLLEVNGRAFEPAELPRTERHGMWLERRSARVETAPDARQWLVMQYQIINAPKQVLNVIVVPLELRDKHGGPNLKIDRWQLAVAPIIANAEALDALSAAPQPDRRAPLIATTALKRNLWLSGGGLLFVLVSWATWVLWRLRRAGSQLPFARTLRQLQTHRNDAPEAWQALHHAFDQTAGCVVHAGALHRLFERAPQFESLRPRIEAFYAQSSRLFFRHADDDASENIRLTELCKALSRLERRRVS